MKLSAFGKKFTANSGIVNLMDDLGNALSENPDIIFMGGGNPGRVPEIESVFQQRLETILADPQQRHSLFGIYQSTYGDKAFRHELADYLRREYGWPVSARNIAISNGSQSAFFVLYNMFAGTMSDGSQSSIHLPISPEYLGYADAGLTDQFFTATRPEIEYFEDHLFKYRVDFSNLKLNSKVAAMCVSRPTNPTGNVLTDDEIEHLDGIAKQYKIPFIVDGAYGLPFPNIIFDNAKPHWNENTILVLSLSKLGLPGIRTGIVIASEDVIEGFTTANTIVSLASSTTGPALAKTWFKNGEIRKLTEQYVTPFYKERAYQTLEWFKQELIGIPYHIHKPEGAIFLWLWFDDLPITSKQLYLKLKDCGVLIIPGEDFFVGIKEDWQHKRQCIRVSYAQDLHIVKHGVEIIAREVKKLYDVG